MSFSSGADTEFPLVRRLDPVPDPVDCFWRLRNRPHCLFLDSALRRPRLGRYSFLAADPFAWWSFAAGDAAALATLEQALSRYPARSRFDLPPFQGGAAGLFGYDLHLCLEQIPRTRFDEFQVPAMAVGLYDVVLAFDHDESSAWLISHGYPESETEARRRRAEQRLEEWTRLLTEPHAPPAFARNDESDRIDAARLAPQFATGRMDQLTSNFSREGYLEAVSRTVEYIRAGDVFQVNLSQRLLYPAFDDAGDLYLRLRQRNPATFAGYLDAGRFQIASASPERFLQVRDRRVEARPIKGTRQRLSFAEASLFAADELLASEKDRAENVMIVDLLRNDLSKVCTPASIQVTELCRLEVYEYVQHLVSAVVGRLREDVTPLDLIRAAFPGGSITGAPKVRAMQIIAELEPTARGAYCGSLGYIGFDGNVDLSILIRTITSGRGWWQLAVGGGITAQSDPLQEWHETWHKATGLLKSLRP